MPGEHFEIQIDKVIDKWAGSVEIGVTSHDPMSLEFPPTMTNIVAGTWMMTGNGVMHNGDIIIEDYGVAEGLRTLKVSSSLVVFMNCANVWCCGLYVHDFQTHRILLYNIRISVVQLAIHLADTKCLIW